MDDQKSLVVFKGAGSLTLQKIETVRALGALFHASGLFPDTQSEAQACVKIMHGMTFGWSPTYAMKNVYIITAKKDDGTWYPPSVEISTQAMAGLVRRSRDYEYRVLTLNESECLIEFRHKGVIVGNSRWNRADAERAELVNRGKKMYLKYPKSMYFAGAMRNGVRQYCADLLQGYGLEISALDDLPDEIAEQDMDVMAVDTQTNGHHEDADDTSADELERAKEALFGASPKDEKPEYTAVTAEGIRDKVQATVRGASMANPTAQATEKQLDYLRSVFCGAVPDDQKRHSVQMWLVGKTSTKDLTKAEAYALLSWLVDPNTKELRDGAAEEAGLCATARMKEVGQGSLFDEGGAGAVEA